jgi:hypothetical protein
MHSMPPLNNKEVKIETAEICEKGYHLTGLLISNDKDGVVTLIELLCGLC